MRSRTSTTYHTLSRSVSTLPTILMVSDVETPRCRIWIGKMAVRYEFCLVACARWESTTIVEWLNYHRSIGFDHVYLYCNDDNPAEFYRITTDFHRGDSPFVTFIYWPNVGDQRGMYMDFIHTRRHAAEWFMFLDIDEFIRIPEVDSIKRFMASIPLKYDDVYFNWLWFGPSDFAKRPIGDVLLNYTRRSRNLYTLTKHLIRSSVFNRPCNLEGPFWHALTEQDGLNWNVCNSLGEDFSKYLNSSAKKRFEAIVDGGLNAQLLKSGVVCHFAFKSTEDLQIRARRSTRLEFADQIDWIRAFEKGEHLSMFASMNEVEDLYLKKYWTSVSGAV